MCWRFVGYVVREKIISRLGVISGVLALLSVVVGYCSEYVAAWTYFLGWWGGVGVVVSRLD